MKNQLHSALMDIVGMLNSPRNDDILLEEAGVSLDRALFPLLVRIDALGPLVVAELADHVGRDHSTVSRQVAKLGQLGLVEREARAGDQRVRAVTITERGSDVADRLSSARQRLFEHLLAGWSEEDRRALARLNTKLAESMKRLATR